MATNNPRFTVKLTDGSEYDVQTITADMLRWERSAATHKWPAAEDAPITWMAFLSWAALKRTGRVELKWEEFSNVVEDVTTATADEVGPTEPGPDTD